MAETVDLFVYVLDAHLYALPLPRVIRVVRAVALTPLPEAPRKVLGAVSVQGDVAPVFAMRRLCGLEERDVALSDQIVLADAFGRMVGLLVDTVRGVHTLPADAVAAPTSVAPGLGLLAGVAGFDDDVLLIHDLDAFLSQEEVLQLDAALRDA